MHGSIDGRGYHVYFMQTELCRSNADGRVSRAYSGQGRSVASVHCSPPPPAERTAKSGERARPRTHAPRTRTRSGGSPPPPRSRPAAGALSAVLTQAPPRPDQAPRSAGAQPSDGAVPTRSRRLCDEPPRGRNTPFPEPTLPPQSYDSRTQPSGPSAQSQGPGARASALREPGRFQHLASRSSR